MMALATVVMRRLLWSESMTTATPLLESQTRGPSTTSTIVDQDRLGYVDVLSWTLL